jgi:Helix-turn-helix domain
VTSTYLTRSQVAERYPISAHTLAKLASQGRGPRYFKPTDKCLYRPEDIEAWIEASAVLPSSPPARLNEKVAPQERLSPKSGRGRARPPVQTPPNLTNARKSLPPSTNSWLRRNE